MAEALGDRRRDIFLVSKVMPQHSSRRGTLSACEASLRRLNTDCLDLMEELAPLSGDALSPIASNQVLCNLTRRGVEHALLPWCRTRGIPVMAYSPLEQGKLAKHKTLQAIGARQNATPAQVALAWVLTQDGVIAIPKSGEAGRVRENRAALDLRFAPEDLDELNAAFPPPRKKTPLEMI